MTGSPCVTANPSVGIAALRENALALIRWQPVQWQAIVTSGGALILRRTCPQRHPPPQGKSGRLANRSTPLPGRIQDFRASFQPTSRSDLEMHAIAVLSKRWYEHGDGTTLRRSSLQRLRSAGSQAPARAVFRAYFGCAAELPILSLPLPADGAGLSRIGFLNGSRQ